MSEKFEPKFRLLRADEIEVRVKTVSEKGATALLYKTARTDMDILDETVGADNWSDDYKEIKGNLYCGIDINGVCKWDCGIESRGDDDGNEKKGEASDAFKRSGFRWGIGRELYTSPFIFLSVATEKDKNGKFKLSGFPSFAVTAIGYDDKRRITSLTIKDEKTGKSVFTFPRGGKQVETDAEQVDQMPERTPEECETVANAITSLRAKIVKTVTDAGRDVQKAKMYVEGEYEKQYKSFVSFDEMNLGQLAFCSGEINKMLSGAKQNATTNT